TPHQIIYVFSMLYGQNEATINKWNGSSRPHNNPGIWCYRCRTYNEPSIVSWIVASLLQRCYVDRDAFTISVRGSRSCKALVDFLLNLNVAQAAKPLEWIDSSSTVTVTADWMGGKEINEDEEVEELELEIRL
ncbi:hypothetical protein HAX54_037722, partial [Datura stramonium]|nr:hypothetical protein [Datura stramonium]